MLMIIYECYYKKYCLLLWTSVVSDSGHKSRPFFTNRKLQQFADEGVIKKSQQGSFFSATVLFKVQFNAVIQLFIHELISFVERHLLFVVSSSRVNCVNKGMIKFMMFSASFFSGSSSLAQISSEFPLNLQLCFGI